MSGPRVAVVRRVLPAPDVVFDEWLDPAGMTEWMLAFRREADTTPMAYLRRVRLNRARQQLIEADPGRETVAAVAARWGFASPSSFTAYYRDAYGTLPSQALHGSQGPLHGS